MDNSQWQFGEGNEYLALDFSRCQRPDGSFYGTGGTCRQGSSVGPKEKEASSGKSGGSSAKGKSSGSSGSSSAKGKTGTTERRAPKRATGADAKRKKLGEEMRKVNEQIKRAGQGGATKALRAKRSRIEEAMNKLKYPKGNSMDRVTESQVRAGGGRLD